MIIPVVYIDDGRIDVRWRSAAVGERSYNSLQVNYYLTRIVANGDLDLHLFTTCVFKVGQHTKQGVPVGLVWALTGELL